MEVDGILGCMSICVFCFVGCWIWCFIYLGMWRNWIVFIEI